MFTAEFKGINSFLVGASKLLLEEGIPRETRGLKCWELPEPFMFKITNPTSRIVTISERRWNPILPFAESLWLASGQNDLNFIGHYLKKMKDFSDDGFFLRGGYGPRLRMFNGISNDYESTGQYNIPKDHLRLLEVDQFGFICKKFEQDINTRQAVISIGDPPKDCFDNLGFLKNTKDTPCTRLLHFQKQPLKNKLDLTVYMRSNDLMWGASAVNIFNYTFILEYFSKILNLEIGNYYHISNNFHYYDEFKDQVKKLSEIENPIDIGHKYSYSFSNLKEFDKLVNDLKFVEEKMRLFNDSSFCDFEDPFFNDWYKILYCYNNHKIVEFENPILENIIRKYLKL